MEVDFWNLDNFFGLTQGYLTDQNVVLYPVLYRGQRSLLA